MSASSMSTEEILSRVDIVFYVLSMFCLRRRDRNGYRCGMVGAGHSFRARDGRWGALSHPHPKKPPWPRELRAPFGATSPPSGVTAGYDCMIFGHAV